MCSRSIGWFIDDLQSALIVGEYRCGFVCWDVFCQMYSHEDAGLSRSFSLRGRSRCSTRTWTDSVKRREGTVLVRA